MSLARPEAGLLIPGTILLVLGSAMGLLYPQGMRLVLDTADGKPTPSWLPSDRPELLNLLIITMVVVAVIQALSIAGRFYLFTVAGERAITRLREALYRRILEQDVAFFDGQRTGDLTNRLSADTTVLQGAVSANISMVLRNLASGIGGIGMLLYTSPKLGLLMLGVVPAIAVGAVFYGRKVRKLSKEVQDRLADASAVADETFGGLRTVRAFAAEKAEVARYKKQNDESFLLAKRRSRASSLFLAVVSFAGYAAAALVFWYGGKLVLNKEMTTGQLTSFLIYTLIVGVSLGALADLWADFMKAVGAAQRVFELLDRKPDIVPEGGMELPSLKGAIAFSKVTFAYPSRPDAGVLKSLSLEVAPGEVVALVGPSGAGKSTLAALVMRFYDPVSGAILVDGHDLRELEPSWLRRQIGTVAQEPILFSSTIADNIRYGRPDASDEEVIAAAKVANAHSFISLFPDGYKTLVGERGIQLSGGQKQRVAIARAVLKDPRILILDEATSALDAESEHLVKEALERLMRGRTTLVIAHRLSTVLGANRVVVIDGGGIVQEGTHQALMAEEGLYKRLVERQFVAA